MGRYRSHTPDSPVWAARMTFPNVPGPALRVGGAVSNGLDLHVWIGFPTEEITPTSDTIDPDFLHGMFPLSLDCVASMEITDGTGAVDDVVRLDVVTPLRWRIPPNTAIGMSDIAGSESLTHASVIAVGVNDRLFGPYDLVSVSSTGFRTGDENVTLVGKVDKLFEETALRHPISTDSSSPPWTSILPLQPFGTWHAELGNALPSIVFGDQATSNTLGAIRSALEEWLVTCQPLASSPTMRESRSPSVTVSSPENLYLDFQRSVQYVPEYPLDYTVIHDYNTYSVTSAGILSAINRAEAPAVAPVDPNYTLGDVQWTLTDIDNDLGAYIDRSILISARSVAAGDNIIIQNGTRRPHIYLEANAISGSNLAQILLDKERWRLQNSARTGSIKEDGAIERVPRQLLSVPDSVLPNPQWRVVSTNHRITPREGFVTTSELVAWQGLWSLDNRAVITI